MPRWHSDRELLAVVAGSETVALDPGKFTLILPWHLRVGHRIRWQTCEQIAMLS